MSEVNVDASQAPEWQLTEEAVNSGDADLLVEFKPGPVPVVVHYFGFKPGESLQNRDGLKIDDVDHVEAVLLMGPETFGKSIEELDKMYPIIDEVIVRQFMIKTQYTKEGEPMNTGRLVMTKEAKFKVAYRNDRPDIYKNWPPDMSRRIDRIMKDANVCIDVQVQDLVDYKAGRII